MRCKHAWTCLLKVSLDKGGVSRGFRKFQSCVECERGGNRTESKHDAPITKSNYGHNGRVVVGVVVPDVIRISAM